MKIANEPVKPPKKFPKFGKLPGRPSELIRLALQDLRAAERSKVLEVDMSEWHVQREGGKCAVCFAGAVMHNRLGAAGSSIPADFSEERRALSALDNFRVGDIDSAFYCLDLELPHHFHEQVAISSYEDGPTKFKRQMAQLATALEKEGY